MIGVCALLAAVGVGVFGTLARSSQFELNTFPGKMLGICVGALTVLGALLGAHACGSFFRRGEATAVQHSDEIPWLGTFAQRLLRLNAAALGVVVIYAVMGDPKTAIRFVQPWFVVTTIAYAGAALVSRWRMPWTRPSSP